MIKLLPTPRNHEIVNNEYHSIPALVYCDTEAWSDSINAFLDSFFKIHELRPALADSPNAGIVITRDTTLAADAYTLDSTGGSLIIRAGDKEGLNYALASALLLISCKDGDITMQSLTVYDCPEKEYRALMIDTGHVWQPFDKMLKYVDLCYIYKIKYLHLHVVDFKLYAIPSKAFPNLNEEGRYYTYEQIDELKRYAAARGILLVPEFECPGHATPLNNAYPEIFANRSEGEQGEFYNELGNRIDTRSLLCAGSEKAFEGIKILLKEMVEMFPDAPYIHIGGDEANYKWWDQCSECKKYMAEHNIGSSHELYSEFVGRVADYVLSLGKTPMVWEGFPKESSHYIPKETVVIAWESHYQLANELLDGGFKIVNASWKPTYIVPSLELRWGPKEILEWSVYNWDHWWEKSVATLNPISVPATDDVLGGTICVWEITYEQAISRILENLPAFAERTWTVRRRLAYPEYSEINKSVFEKASAIIEDK
ncbi:MAG: family 20 glycosylhydrolase [Clostridia bacterium]|nr:family 20 glycosylhydrolase [Clostridia bacterium]